MFDPKKLMDMMKNATEMQQKMQEELKSITVFGTAGGDLVQVSMNGQFELLSLKIDPSIVKQEEVTFLEDLVKAALNDAVSKAREAMTAHMKSLTGKFGF